MLPVLLETSCLRSEQVLFALILIAEKRVKRKAVDPG
jgi:hypothetical protein